MATTDTAERPEVLVEQGKRAFRAGRWREAEPLFARAASLLPTNPVLWIHLAMTHKALGDTAAEEQDLSRALLADPHDLVALLLKGDLCLRTGRRHEAASAYGAACAVAPAMPDLAPSLRPALEQALRFQQSYRDELTDHLDQALRPAFRDMAGADLDRFKLSIDILTGRKARYESRPLRYFFPQLVPVEFFDNTRFPWIESVEKAFPDILGEFLSVASHPDDFEPYIQYAEGQPLAQWSELNHSLKWSAWHLWKDGAPIDSHVQRCPVTAQTLRSTPQPDQPGRTPSALFSVLKPKTRIPPHVGASNARLVCHLALVIPEGCRFRVGNSERQWREGRVWVFDDTIEHEAINDSHEARAVMIWDTWHPDLSDAERRMVTSLNRALNEFSGVDAAYSA